MNFSVFKKTSKLSSETPITSDRIESAMEDGSLSVYFMPVVQIGARSTTGVEALLRWQVTDDQFIPPMDFIPLAQEYGLMPKLTRWVIQKVISWQAQWRKRQVILHWSINTTGSDISDPSLVDHIASTLREYQVPASCLGLEVSQRTMQNIGKPGLNNLQKYKKLGVTLILDNVDPQQDTVIASELWDHIKIERSLIMNVVGKPELEGLIASFVEHYHTQGITMTASGVHTFREWQFVSQIGCDTAQGFYLSPPQSITELEVWLQISNWGYQQAPSEASA